MAICKQIISKKTKMMMKMKKKKRRKSSQIYLQKTILSTSIWSSMNSNHLLHLNPLRKDRLRNYLLPIKRVIAVSTVPQRRKQLGLW
jgi:hypothetical protein